MNRREAHLWPGPHHPWAAPATTMIEGAAVRVCGGGGGRRGLCRQVGLAQRHELQGRIHGPAHQLSERALVLAAIGHRREHVFARLRSRSDGKSRSERDPDRRSNGFHGTEPNPARAAATDLAPARKWALRTPARTAGRAALVAVLGPLFELRLVG